MTSPSEIIPVMSSRKFWTSLGFTALIAVLQFVANDPAFRSWSAVILALIGSISVWAVPNKVLGFRRSDGQVVNSVRDL